MILFNRKNGSGPGGMSDDELDKESEGSGTVPERKPGSQRDFRASIVVTALVAILVGGVGRIIRKPE